MTERKFRHPDRLFSEENEQLTEEVWSHRCWPDSCNPVPQAVSKLPLGVREIYWHVPSMNLVLVHATGEKVGIRAVDLHRGIRQLAELKKAGAAN